MNYIIENNFNINNLDSLNSSCRLISEQPIFGSAELLSYENIILNSNKNISICESSISSFQRIAPEMPDMLESGACERLQQFFPELNQINYNLNDIYNLSNNKSYDFFLKKKKLIEIVKNLSHVEYNEIFNIFKENNCQYTENANGVFINLQNINENILDKIFNFIDYSKQKRIELNEHEEFINNAKKNISFTKKEKEITNNILISEKDNYVNYNYYDSDSDTIIKNSNDLLFSSDEEEDIENKISLKKKKNKYIGKKAKIIKSIKNDQDNKLKNK
jgi:hypothetical protein